MIISGLYSSKEDTIKPILTIAPGTPNTLTDSGSATVKSEI